MAKGKIDREITVLYNISQHTVQKHARHISEFGVETRVASAHRAIEGGGKTKRVHTHVTV